jgi:transcriptional regulator with XRE-family HTH domain
MPKQHQLHLLKAERELRGWSLDRLAEALGTTARAVSRWERGLTVPTLHYCEQLCVLYGKNARELGLPSDTSEDDIAQQAAPPISPVKGNVVMCRLDDEALAAIDILVEAGIRTTRSDAASWLIQAGIQVHQPLLQKISGTAAQIQRLREQAQSLVDEMIQASCDPPSHNLEATSGEATRSEKKH